MARAFGFVYQRRPQPGLVQEGRQPAVRRTAHAGEYILVLDADFTPRPDLLDEMLPYLDADPTLGIVQSPQYFRVARRQSWLERGAGAVQELFYRIGAGVPAAPQAARSASAAARSTGGRRWTTTAVRR